MYIVSGIEIFSLGSEGANILATWAFNKRVRDGIGLVQLRLLTDKKNKGKKIRVKNPEDCRELSHHDHHVEREV
ncbi:hypothetical protein, partial [Microcoleus sp. D2_18a_D3]|uniref:hypothetical protein n=1 Tax=Microcoleus sp. D2_18a_D3 TaxID=3055330 RepID=UPI002FD2C51F